MNIPRKKENLEQPVIVSRITRLPVYLNSLKEIKQRNWNLWWRTIYERLMNEIIARSRTRGSPRWREKTTMTTCSSRPDIPLHKSLYHLQHPWVGVLHQINAKTVLQRNWTKSIWRETSRLWGIPERDSCIQMEEDNLVKNLQCTTEAWWRFSITKILYQDDYSVGQISWWQKKCQMDMFQFSNNDILYWSELHETFKRKPVFQTEVHLKSSITLSVMKSRKEKVVLQYISPQMSR